MESRFGPVVFSVHVYGMWGSGEAEGCTTGLWDRTFTAYLDKVRSLKLPILIGETGANTNKADELWEAGGSWNALKMETRVLPKLPLKVGVLVWHGSSGSPFSLYDPAHNWTEYDQYKQSINWIGQFMYDYAHQVNPG